MFITGVNDFGDKLFSGVDDSGKKFIAGVFSTVGLIGSNPTEKK
jgi:hypothetical protein